MIGVFNCRGTKIEVSKFTASHFDSIKEWFNTRDEVYFNIRAETMHKILDYIEIRFRTGKELKDSFTEGEILFARSYGINI